jgi:hypothetical protein
MITAIDASEVTKALEQILIQDTAIGQRGVYIERSGDPDMDPGEQGYVLIFRERLAFTPRTLGMGAGFREQRINLILLVAQSNATSGSDCEDDLEDLIKRVTSCLLNNYSIGGTVDNLGDDFEVRYESYAKSGERFQQKAALFISGIVKVRAI